MRPITNLDRKTKAIWTTLQQNGFQSNVVGWWPSHPVEPISGVMVSNHYQPMVAAVDKPWPMRPGTVHPPHLIEHPADLRIHPADLEPEMLLPFIPRAAEIDQHKDFRLANVARILAETAMIHAAANTLRELRYNLARDLLDAGLIGDVIPLFEELRDTDPDARRGHPGAAGA